MLEDIRFMTSLKIIIMKMLHIHKCKDGIMVKPPHSHNSDSTVVLFFFFAKFAKFVLSKPFFGWNITKWNPHITSFHCYIFLYAASLRMSIFLHNHMVTSSLIKWKLFLGIIYYPVHNQISLIVSFFKEYE